MSLSERVINHLRERLKDHPLRHSADAISVSIPRAMIYELLGETPASPGGWVARVSEVKK